MIWIWDNHWRDWYMVWVCGVENKQKMPNLLHKIIESLLQHSDEHLLVRIDNPKGLHSLVFTNEMESIASTLRY
ncbi:hypothetical protein Sjap_012506 [Stephania japonica]|uniref:Uncharacterized protein n=1 Tax=Stephania japonica TaxID=461633 RepID=A0AAP0NYB5_9MAGN